MKRHQTAGFTLIELIIVIAIIAILASLAFMSLSGETAQARDSKRVGDLKTYEDSIATANGKNKRIHFEIDNEGKQLDGKNRTDAANPDTV
nr:prepilin-type N-terminal cleavage/methylation domain-containing protein [Candidatus Gracilibacteria bacterium]